MDDEPTLESQVRRGPDRERRVRLWPRLFALAFLSVVMLLALGGTSKASELDPIETVTGTLDPVGETVTDKVDPVGETVTDTVDPVVETVTDTVDPVVETVTDTVDPVVETVQDTVDPVVETVKETVDPVVETIGVAVPEPKAIDPGLPLSRVIVSEPRSAEVVLDGRTAERTGAFGGGSFGGDLPLAAASTTMAPSIGVSGTRAAGGATDEGSTGGPNLPLGGSGAGQSLTLLILFAALATTVRAFRPPILFSIVPRAVAMQSAALALSVERPG
jgi:hypothetical protein